MSSQCEDPLLSSSTPDQFVGITNDTDRSDLDRCIWNEFLDPSKIDKDDYARMISFLCCLILMFKKGYLTFRETTSYESYELLYKFVTAMLMRVSIPRACLFLDEVQRKGEPQDRRVCQFCALIENFFVVLEIETLTHICIDRFVTAKYIQNGWPLNKKHYRMYFYICIFLSAIYAWAPRVGAGYLGRYWLDFDCVTCTLDNHLPDDWTKYIIVNIFFMRSVKPVLIMALMLFSAYRIEQSFTGQMRKRSQAFFTNSMAMLTIVNVSCWLPLATIRAQVLTSQLFGSIVFMYSVDQINMAEFIYELSPAFTTLSIMMSNVKLLNIYEEAVLASMAAVPPIIRVRVAMNRSNVPGNIGRVLPVKAREEHSM